MTSLSPSPQVFHGGRLDEAVAQYGGIKGKWLDLSTGINPSAYPVGDLPATAWHALPDNAAEVKAEQAARACYGVAEEASLSMAPGTQAHIQQLPFLFKPQDVAIVGFTYQEHGVCWSRAGHSVFVTDGLESAEATARIIVVVNPNNPDGRVCDPEALKALARRLGPKGGLLVVDESFGDVMPEVSLVPECGRDGLLVMRSLGKFFGLAGARFGVAVGAVGLCERLNERLGPWAVSGPALHAATTALADKKWQLRTRKKLAEGRMQLERVLKNNGLTILGGTDLFVLAQYAHAQELAQHLAQNHILVRPFPAKPDWLRFGLPGGKVGLNRLGKALASFEAQ
ncbi:MAG: threonine-phosphate decarboxylase CobD [Pseudomonadota bacterium]